MTTLGWLISCGIIGWVVGQVGVSRRWSLLRTAVVSVVSTATFVVLVRTLA